jgi:hypothetical protein
MWVCYCFLHCNRAVPGVINRHFPFIVFFCRSEAIFGTVWTVRTVNKHSCFSSGILHEIVTTRYSQTLKIRNTNRDRFRQGRGIDGQWKV